MNEAQRRKAWVTDIIDWHPHWTARQRERAFFLMPHKVDLASGRITQERYDRRMAIYLAYITVPNRPPFPKGTTWDAADTLCIGKKGY